MKYVFLALLILCATERTFTQIPLSEIEGRLSIYLPQDTTSLHIGKNAGAFQTSSSKLYTTIVGTNAGLKNNGDENCFFGFQAGLMNNFGAENSFYGYKAGQGNFNGNYNSFFGYFAGANIISGSDNICIGSASGPTSAGSALNNRLYIDIKATNDPLIYGEFDNNFLRINGTQEIKATEFQLLMDNPNAGGATWRVGSSSSDWNIGSGKLVIGTSTNSANGHLFITNLGSVGIGVSSPTEELDIDGDLRIGNLSGSGIIDIAVNDFGKIVFSASDKRLKKNIQTLEGSLLKVNQLRGVSYEWKEGPNPTKTYGLIAQEVLQAVPEIVTQHEGYYGINYSELPALLVEAIKEQQSIIERQGQEIKTVKSQLKKKDEEFISLLRRIEDLEAKKDANHHSLVKVSPSPLK